MFAKFRRRERSTASTNSIPNATRVYAIGDVHGCLDQLEELLGKIADDAAAYDGVVRLVQLGDLVDRGPRSNQVVERMRKLVEDGAAEVIAGNHEEAMLRVFDGIDAPTGWLSYGGMQTLESYGIERREHFSAGFDLARRMEQAVPASHVDFLRSLPDHLTIGDYLFVHAGIRPGVPVEQQHVSDLHWIRSEFLESEADHGRVVVHGHTIVPEPDLRANRIGIDTGAYAGGPLTAVVLEGSERRFLQIGSI